jgi:UDP-glucuronate 4-epimerase
MNAGIQSAALRHRRILVTGAAGFIGFHVAVRLLDAGAQVLGLDNLNDYYDVSLKQARLDRLGRPAFAFARIDIADSAGLTREMAAFKPDAVIHLAAQAGVRHSLTNPQAYASANLTGFLNLLEACREHPVKHLIYASSSSVYGANTKLPFSETDKADHPVSLYGATKRANELMAHAYAHLFAIPATGLRFFTVYGPWGRPDMAYFSFTRKIATGEPIDVFNEGRMERDFTYIDDVVDAILALVGRAPLPARDAPDTKSAPHTGAPRTLHCRHRKGRWPAGCQKHAADAVGRRSSDLCRCRRTCCDRRLRPAHVDRGRHSRLR